LYDSTGARGSLPTCVLHLFNGPYITACGARLEIPKGSTPLLVLVALRRPKVDRQYAASALWPMGDDRRAAGNLRSALWHLKHAGIQILLVDKYNVGLRDDVVVDVEIVNDWASRLIAGIETPDDLEPHPSLTAALDLLPGWYDEWVLIERERTRQRVLHGLEAQSRALVRAGRLAEAVEVAMTAVSSEPLRESAQLALLGAHLAEGNRIEAHRAFRAYRHLLLEELGVEPSPAFVAAISSSLPASLAAPTASQRADVVLGRGLGVMDAVRTDEARW
jgi:DNA-binding SARP family transcriptional activator